MSYVLKDGYTWNPLLKYPRNEECFCFSGVKFKKCCMNDVAEVVTYKQAREIQAAVEAGRQIMITDEKTDVSAQAEVKIGSDSTAPVETPDEST